MIEAVFGSAILFIVIFGISLMAFLLPKRFRKKVWVTSWIVFIIGFIAFAAWPAIVDMETSQAIEQMDKHLQQLYPEESWEITRSDGMDIHSIIIYVIFESEPEISYEYIVEDTRIEQVHVWTSVGGPLMDRDIELKHVENN